MQKYPSLYNKDLGDDEDLGAMDKIDTSSGQTTETKLTENLSPK